MITVLLQDQQIFSKQKRAKVYPEGPADGLLVRPDCLRVHAELLHLVRVGEVHAVPSRTCSNTVRWETFARGSDLTFLTSAHEVIPTSYKVQTLRTVFSYVCILELP